MTRRNLTWFLLATVLAVCAAAYLVYAFTNPDVPATQLPTL